MREVIEEANGLLIKFVKDQAEAIDKEEAEAKKASKKVQFECTLCIPNSGKKVGHTGPHKRKPGKRKASGSGMGNNENQCKKGKLEPTFNECTKCTPNSGKEAGHQGNHTGGKKKAAKKSGAFFMWLTTRSSLIRLLVYVELERLTYLSFAHEADEEVDGEDDEADDDDVDDDEEDGTDDGEDDEADEDYEVNEDDGQDVLWIRTEDPWEDPSVIALSCCKWFIEKIKSKINDL